MTNTKASYKHWASESLDASLTQQIARLRNLKDVKHLRIMPDVHLSHNVCIGSVLATDQLIYPAAIGGDIGCGMLAMKFDGNASAIGRSEAGAIFELLRRRVPILKQPGERENEQFYQQLEAPLSHEPLRSLAEREGKLQLGTLGRGNHFLEFQEDDASGDLWVMIHTGSRAIGPAIRDHYEKLSEATSGGLRYFSADSEIGQQYLRDHQWARHYAKMNRQVILHEVAAIILHVLGMQLIQQSTIDCDHNHLQREQHGTEALWVHRKGALAVHQNMLAIIPGSMGTSSFHVKGAGNIDSLCSSSHGAGRCMSRNEARHRISHHRLSKELEGVFYENDRSKHLVEESPSAYKDISKVMKAQKKLVSIVRRLSPVLSYKG